MAKPNDFDFYCDEVLSGKTSVKKLYESKKVIAFHHTKPSFATHIIIIPKEHIHDLTYLKDRHKPLLLEIIKVTKKLLKKIGLEKGGARLVTNIGKYQESPHLHFHLISGKQIKT